MWPIAPLSLRRLQCLLKEYDRLLEGGGSFIFVRPLSLALLDSAGRHLGMPRRFASVAPQSVIRHCELAQNGLPRIVKFLTGLRREAVGGRWLVRRRRENSQILIWIQWAVLPQLHVDQRRRCHLWIRLLGQSIVLRSVVDIGVPFEILLVDLLALPQLLDRTTILRHSFVVVVVLQVVHHDHGLTEVGVITVSCLAFTGLCSVSFGDVVAWRMLQLVLARSSPLIAPFILALLLLREKVAGAVEAAGGA